MALFGLDIENLTTGRLERRIQILYTLKRLFLSPIGDRGLNIHFLHFLKICNSRIFFLSRIFAHAHTSI